RLSRWKGLSAAREPLVFVLHMGYAWLALGLLFLGLNGFAGWVAQGAPLHALTVGAIGTMTLAVMTRASLGHSGRPLAAGAGTIALYLLVTLAACLRMGAAFSTHYAVITSLAACDVKPPRPDPYDVSKMDLKPAPAKVGGERNKGAFAEGASLSKGAELKPLDPSPVKTVRLDTTHKVIEIAPGVKFSAWTFGDQVPGPTVRARVGDRIRFVMTNRSDEPAPVPQLVAAPMMHSMDFHAAMVSPQDKYRSIAPGQTIEFAFTANYPGIFMYHCGTPMILEHIASGMYGAVIVEPKNG